MIKMEEEETIEENKISGEFEVFYDEIKEVNGTLMLSIPRKVGVYGGFDKGTPVKCYIKKQQ